MEQQPPPEFILDAFSDPESVRDVVSGILHTIFFHRYFPSLAPSTRPVLGLTLPHVDEAELETLIEQRASALHAQLDAERQQQQQLHHASSAGGGGGGGLDLGGASGGGASRGRGQVVVQFFEKKRRKSWLRGDEEVCWERWTVKVTVAEPRTDTERAKVRRAMEQTLLAAVFKIIDSANAHKDHIPPITTSETNPFPYQISVNQREPAWGARMVLGR